MTEKSEKSSLGIVIGILVFFFIAIFACAGAIMGAIEAQDMKENAIGVVEIKGPITSADKTVRTIQNFTDDDQIKAMLIRIDSPGGSVSASQEMVEAIQSIKKPVVISMGDMAASGGYYVACAGPTIYANPGTLTGSIGVISNIIEYGDLMSFFRIHMHTVKTGDLKDAGSPYREFNEKDKAYFTALGLEILDQFVDHVATARKLPKEEVSKLADGRVWTGREAKNLGLIDEIGGMNKAIDGLKEKANLKGKHTLVYPELSTEEFLSSALSQGATDVVDKLKTSAENAILPSQPGAFQYLYQQ